jgi:hypothetical protein
MSVVVGRLDFGGRRPSWFAGASGHRSSSIAGSIAQASCLLVDLVASLSSLPARTFGRVGPVS